MSIITLVIVAATCVLSFVSFSNQKLTEELIFYPPAISDRNQWYRFFTCGFIHADIPHLFFNMYSFYMFGDNIENMFEQLFGSKGKIIYLLLYVSSLFICLVPTYINHRHDYLYRSLGASGAVSAIVFAFIFLDPTAGIGLIFIPIHAPAFLFGIIYLVISAILAQRGQSHINHSAHLWGALYGIVFLIITTHFLSDYNVIDSFVIQVRAYLKM